MSTIEQDLRTLEQRWRVHGKELLSFALHQKMGIIGHIIFDTCSQIRKRRAIGPDIQSSHLEALVKGTTR